MKRKIFLLLIILLITVAPQAVFAVEPGTGLAEPEVIDLPNSEIPKAADRQTATQSAQAAVSEWDKYTNYYYYNQLDASKKAAWDDLRALCEEYVSGTKDVPYYYTDSSGNEMGYIEMVTLSQPLTSTELKQFWCMFVYANPQYYFLKNSYMRSGASGDTYSKLALVVYEAFWDGGERAAATAQVKQQLASWQTLIDACATDEEKIQKIQDIICAKVTYYDEAAAGSVDEDETFSQSPYSVICLDKTVCAGYADTFCMLCNASGIDTISVTSPGHQWSKVRVKDSWYNFDVTWDDTYTDSWEMPVYLYYGRSDEMYDCDFESGSASNIESHQEETYWEPYLPLCTLDSNPVYPYSTPGSFTAGTVQAAMPQIDVSYEGEGITVSLTTTTAGATIYYTVDGTDPSVTGKNTFVYGGSFSVEPDTQVKAIAVLDTYADSEVASKLVQLEEYPIAYVLDGGVNHTDNPATYNIKDAFTLQKPSKAGYIFGGWFADEDCLQQVTGVTAGNTGERTFYASWSPITYTISYHGNGATGGSMSAQGGCAYDTAYTLAEANYEKNGYTFAGWNTQADGTGTAYAGRVSVSNLTVVDKETVTLYAQWSPITYSVVFDENGSADGNMSELDGCKYDASYTLAANNFKKTGYTFDGWNTEADGSGNAYADKATVKNLSATDGTEIVLYAQWSPIAYSIAYDGNGATGGSMSVQSGCKYDTGYALAAVGYKKTGYLFTGWNTQADGSGETYADKKIVKNLAESDGAEIIFYAQWIPVTYTIAFDGNGATDGEMNSLAPCKYATSYLLPENAYERTGYRFGGWNTKADGTGISYSDGTSVKNLSETDATTATLYAQWIPITYTIIFDGNSAESGTLADMTSCEYDAAYALPLNVYTKKWNAFIGWNTEADGSGTWYKDGEVVKNLSSADGESITLYAQWMMTTYHIAFDGNGATSGSMESISDCKYDMSYELTESVFSKTGYIFAGWNTEADGSGDAYTDGASVQNLTNEDEATVTLYAQWTPVTYSVIFDGNGATSGITAAMSGCEYDSSYMLTAAGYKKTGYTFNGWNTKKDGTGKAYANKATVKNLTVSDGAAIRLYAQWRANTYTVKYDGNKATGGSMSAQTLLLYGKNYVLSANKYKRTGYKFTGWNTQKNGKGTFYKNLASVQNLSSVNGAVITLYAQWQANTYHVKFNGNGATGGSMKKLKNCNYDKKYKLTANKFKKKGYKFVGWNTKKNGKGKMYKNKAKIKNLTPKNGKTVTLYAQWKKIK